MKYFFYSFHTAPYQKVSLPQRSFKNSFTLIEIILSLILMAIFLTTIGFSLTTFMKKRSFLNDIRSIQAYFEDAIRLSKITQHEVDIMLFSNVNSTNQSSIALSLLLWGAPQNDVKKRLETPAILSSIGSFTIDTDKDHSNTVQIGEMDIQCIRLFPREIHEDFQNGSITFFSHSEQFQTTIDLTELWKKIGNSVDLLETAYIPDSIEQEVLGVVQ